MLWLIVGRCGRSHDHGHQRRLNQCHLITVRTRTRHADRNAIGFSQQTALAPALGAIGGVRSGRFPMHIKQKVKTLGSTAQLALRGQPDGRIRH